MDRNKVADKAWCHHCDDVREMYADDNHVLHCMVCGTQYNERKVPRGDAGRK